MRPILWRKAPRLWLTISGLNVNWYWRRTGSFKQPRRSLRPSLPGLLRVFSKLTNTILYSLVGTSKASSFWGIISSSIPLELICRTWILKWWTRRWRLMRLPNLLLLRITLLKRPPLMMLPPPLSIKTLLLTPEPDTCEKKNFFSFLVARYVLGCL